MLVHRDAARQINTRRYSQQATLVRERTAVEVQQVENDAVSVRATATAQANYLTASANYQATERVEDARDVEARGAARAGSLSGALRSLVRFSSAAQTLKGALTAGPARAVGYARRKLLKGSGYPS